MTTRYLSIGLSTLVLAACGDSGVTSTSDGETAGATTGTTDDSGPPTTTQTTKTSDTPTTGDTSTSSDSNSGDETSGTDSSTGDATDTTDTTSPAVPECGNGVPEGGEQCDDGNQVAGDGCEPSCVNTPECGNGVPEEGEVCDDGNTENGDECSADCQIATPTPECGDGTIQEPEQCDDGNKVDGDGCQADCTVTPPECGNGIPEANEQCDDGNDVNGGPGDFCKNDCTAFVPASCNAPAEYVICDEALNLADKADKTQAHKSIGICNDAPAESIVITDWSFNAADNASWQIARGFGSYMHDDDMDPNTPDKLLYSPREGDTMLILSTGTIAAPNADGVVVQPPNSQAGFVGSNANPDLPDEMPAPMFALDGSNNGLGGTPFKDCDGVHDCSDTLQYQWNVIADGDPNDKLWFTFKTKVPAGTFGYTFDFVFCSGEWPTFVDSSFNDLLVAWQVDPTADDPDADPPVDPYTGNVTFIPDPNDPAKGLPLTITALDPYYDGPGYTFAEPQLQGTGFEQHACSDWFTAKGGVQPGADLTIGFFITDLGDPYYTSTAILDNFRWDCKGCVPSEVDDCGVMPPT
jgi:cysteine-rich repeat protein